MLQISILALWAEVHICVGLGFSVISLCTSSPIVIKLLNEIK